MISWVPVDIFDEMVRAMSQALSTYLHEEMPSRICQGLGSSDGITARRLIGIDHLSCHSGPPETSAGVLGWGPDGKGEPSVPPLVDTSANVNGYVGCFSDNTVCKKQQRCGVVMVLPGTQH